MAIDKNEFFRKAALRICGNLEIDKALFGAFEYLETMFPLDAMYIQLFEENPGSMRIIGKADKKGGARMDLLIPLSGKTGEAITKGSAAVMQLPSGPVWIVNDPDEEPISRAILSFLGEKEASLMGMLLLVKNKPIGSLICLARGKQRYSGEHLELLAILREPFFIALSNTLAHRELKELKDKLLDDNRFLQQELMMDSVDTIIGSGSGLKGVMKMVRQVANLDSPVLLLGETGTGKDLIANALHHLSSRSEGPFITVNCGAIPASLIDSELFGHEKGAFTGAVSSKRGRFERANQGTIFLDEIGELPLQAQVRLLRVLQNREIERVGGTKTISLDIRIIAATNRDLEKMAAERTFRDDLWFRLTVFPIHLPSLRERKSDIQPLVRHFITKKVKGLGLKFIPEPDPDSIDILTSYSWPGNVRELENVVERALILNRDKVLKFKNLLQNRPGSNMEMQGDTDSFCPLNVLISTHIKKALKKTGGKIHGPGGAAELLGIHASTLRNRMNKLGITYKK